MVKKAEEGSSLARNAFDVNFDKHKCKIDTIVRESDEYKMINQYVQNSREYFRVELLNAIKLEREGEAERFNPKGLSNRALLWHGSRFSNFVGILSQGLRIAPPEAPSTGYLFGKGIYFADMLGKSGNYCCYHLSDNIGLFLLCDVALGNPVKYK